MPFSREGRYKEVKSAQPCGVSRDESKYKIVESDELKMIDRMRVCKEKNIAVLPLLRTTFDTRSPAEG